MATVFQLFPAFVDFIGHRLRAMTGLAPLK